jgi:chloramphenicol O-acetyltransferase type A
MSFLKIMRTRSLTFTANMDVTAVGDLCRQNGLVISLTLLYYSLVAANQIREFRIRLVGDRLVEFDRVHATQTILNDDETFSFAYFEMRDDVFEFNRVG